MREINKLNAVVSSRSLVPPVSDARIEGVVGSVVEKFKLKSINEPREHTYWHAIVCLMSRFEIQEIRLIRVDCRVNFLAVLFGPFISRTSAILRAIYVRLLDVGVVCMLLFCVDDAALAPSYACTGTSAANITSTMPGPYQPARATANSCLFNAHNATT